MTGTRRQHHVWRSYLEAWATDAQIFCLQEGRIFRTNVANVGVERDFYKLHMLTDADIQGIRLLMSTGPSVATPVLENAAPAMQPTIERFSKTWGSGSSVPVVLEEDGGVHGTGKIDIARGRTPQAACSSNQPPADV